MQARESALEDVAVDAVSVSVQPAGRRVVRKCVDHLLSRPSGRRMIRDVDMHDAPTMMRQQDQDDTAPSWLHRDRDRIYGDVFQRRVAGMGIAEVVSAPASPWQNPYVERLIGSIPTRVSRSRDRHERGASPAHPQVVRAVLSSEPDASWPREGHARSPTDLWNLQWADRRDPRSRWSPSPL